MAPIHFRGSITEKVKFPQICSDEETNSYSLQEDDNIFNFQFLG